MPIKILLSIVYLAYEILVTKDGFSIHELTERKGKDKFMSSVFPGISPTHLIPLICPLKITIPLQ